MNYMHFVVLVTLPGPLHLGAVVFRCSKVSQLGPVNTYSMLHFSGMRTHGNDVRACPRPKMYMYVTVWLTAQDPNDTYMFLDQSTQQVI